MTDSVSRETIWRPVTVALRDLVPWERNPKHISKAHATRLLDLWQRIGQFQTISIGPNGEVYDGHQRLNVLKAAHGAGYEVMALQSSRALTEQEREELTIAAHSGTTGTWDWDALSGWDADNLQQWGFDGETLTNWQADIGALGAMLASEEEPPPDDPGAQIDKAEELRELWGVQPGQLWQLGEHRLICGDCTDAAAVARVMGGERAQACVTDPPWNVGWSYDTYQDDLTPEQYKEFSDKWRELAETTGAGLFFVALSMKTYRHFHSWFPMAERILAECQNFTQHTGGFMQSAFNPILIWGQSEKKSAAGQRDWYLAETSITKMTPDKVLAKINTATRWLPTVEYLVSFTDDDSLIYEPFSGSGTTLIACERLNRRCRAIEISPAYCAVSIQRWVDMTGGTPELLP